MATFSADQVVGKSLTAKKSVQLKTGGYDSSPIFSTVLAGQPVGVVTSWLNPGPGRTALYWIVSTNGKTLYVKHEEGAFDITTLQVQGAKTSEQLLQEQKDKDLLENSPMIYYFKKIVVPVLIAGAIIYVVVQFGKTFIAAKVKGA